MPHPGPQEFFHQVPAYEALFGGKKGPGKTETILRESVRQIGNKNYRGIIFRRTYPRLGEIIDRSHKYFKLAGLNGKYSDHDIQVKIPAWTFPSGAKIAFGHCHREQDKYDWHGKEFHFIGFDQLEEFTETQYLFILAQNRTSDPAIWCYTRSTANPGGVGHAWVKKRFIDTLKNCPSGTIKFFKRVDDEDLECPESDPQSISRAFVEAGVYDNPSLVQNDPNYIRRLEQLPEDDKQALLYGNWDVFKGQFFKMWRKAHHVKELEVFREYEKFISLDYGYGAPSCVLWWMVDYDGNLHAYRELYGEEMTYEKLALLIRELTPHDERINYCVADPAIWNDKSHHKSEIEGESGAETMQRLWAGWTGLIRADNSRITGWGRMRIMLSNPPAMSYSPVCKHSIRTIPALIHDEVKVEDLDTDGEDHAADSSRYALMSRPQAALRKKPRSKDPAMPLAGELLEVEMLSPWKKWNS